MSAHDSPAVLMPASGGSYIREADGSLTLASEVAPVAQEEPESRPEKPVKGAVKTPVQPDLKES